MDRLEKDVLMTSETVGLFVSQICNELSHPLILLGAFGPRFIVRYRKGSFHCRLKMI